MKNILVILIFTISSIFSQHYHQNLTEDDKNWILSNIGSEEYGYTAVDGVINHNIVEAEDSLIKYIWRHDYDRTVQVDFVEALRVINSTQAHYYAIALMDTLEVKSFGRDIFPTFSEDKVLLTSTLFKLGDYSTAEYVFELLDKYKPEVISFEALQLLPGIIENAPQFAQRAKEELIYAITFASDSRDRLYALNSFYEIYGDEAKQYMIQMFVADSSAANRGTALLYHLFRYYDLNELYRERLYLEEDSAVRLEIIKEILWQYPTPFNYQFVRDYLQYEPDSIVVSVGDLYLNVLKIPEPDSSLTVEILIDQLINIIDSTFFYAWLGDLQFKNQLQNVLQLAKTNLLAGDSLSCAMDVKSFQDSVDFVYKDSLNADPHFVTLEGWKFLYWNAQYILDRLPSPPVIVNADIEVINPAMSLVNPDAFTMEIKGSGFSSSSIVYFNGNSRATTFISDSVLNTQILSTDVSVAGNYPVWVSDNTLNSDTLIYKVVSILPQPVSPVLECVTNNGDGTYTAFFGYKNENSVSVYIPVGSKNKFTPTPQDRGQTRVFKPGRQIKVYTVNFNGSNLVWTLNGRTSTASSNSTPCQ
jgi:hypothetical protein